MIAGLSPVLSWLIVIGLGLIVLALVNAYVRWSTDRWFELWLESKMKELKEGKDEDAQP